MLLQEHHDTKGRRIVLQMGEWVACTRLPNREKGMLLQKYGDGIGRCVVILLIKQYGVQGLT